MDNRFQLDVNKDVWVLYKKHGPSLYYNRMDFTIINSPSMRLEVKHYMKQRFMADIRLKDRFLSRIAYAVNLMTMHNPNIRYFADVDDVDAKTLHIALENADKTNHGREKSQINIMNVFSSCKIICAYLMGNMRDESIKSPRPYQNPFAKFIFRNSKDYVKNTPVMPEHVMEQIEAHIGELQKVYQLMFKIFANTGMRAKEVLFLERELS
jgi:integrase